LREASFHTLGYFFVEFAGKFIYINGDIYEGAFSDGCKCGKGQGISVCVILRIKKF